MTPIFVKAGRWYINLDQVKYFWAEGDKLKLMLGDTDDDRELVLTLQEDEKNQFLKVALGYVKNYG